MIAIAGAKGGCGKTTTTLGLARAFDREGRLSFVIDADQQLPNIHVAAGVDREPTVGELESDGDAATVAQPLPGAERAGVLPAPKPSEPVELTDLLERFSTAAGVSLVDCPAGAGPDASGPIAAADRVVVVTTGTERSLISAEKTVDLAGRLDTPVAGVVLNQCEQAPVGFRSKFDVPLLGRVPPFQPPEPNPQARAAYDHVASELLAQRGGPASPTTTHPKIRLPTGLAPVDRMLDGGVPAGSVVAVSAEPGSRSELLLHAVTRERGTLYLTLDESPDAVRDGLSASIIQTGDPTIRQLDEGAMLADGQQLFGRLPDRTNVVVDPMARLEEHNQSAYQEFLETLADAVQTTDSVALLHTLDRSPTPRNRVTTERFVDLMLRCAVDTSGAEPRYELSVLKTERDDIISESDSVELTSIFSDREQLVPGPVLNGHE